MASKNEGHDLNLVGAGTVVEGKLHTPGSIRIDGKVVGDVNAAQNVHVGTSGEVEGTITGRNVTIGGKVTGTIVAQEKLVLEGKAVIKGDIHAAKLVIDEGAAFDGQCVMSEVRPAGNVVDLKSEMRRAEDR